MARAPVGAAAAIERRNVQRMLHGVVRSTAAAAPAVVSAAVRARLHAAVREPVDGEAVTGDERTRGPQRAQPARASAARSAVASSGSSTGAGSADAIGERQRAGARAPREARARMGVAATPMCVCGNGPRRHRSDDAARDALRPMRGTGGPGCRAAGRGPRDCR